MFEVKDYSVRLADNNKEVVSNVSFCVNPGEVVALMGPNGSGKSSLAQSLMGHPKYVCEGEALLDGVNLLDLEPDERARAGLFLSFQYPCSVPGVRMSDFLRAAYNNTHEPLSFVKFRRLLREKMSKLNMDPSFADRYVNEGWSGGEKKRGEILQLSLLKPKIAILDETDSGLDIDAIKIVSKGVNDCLEENPDMGVIIITHYKRILEYIKPDRVLILVNGSLVLESGPEIVDELEKKGYDWIS